jgi:hypothetical protein
MEGLEIEEDCRNGATRQIREQKLEWDRTRRSRNIKRHNLNTVDGDAVGGDVVGMKMRTVKKR